MAAHLEALEGGILSPRRGKCGEARNSVFAWDGAMGGAVGRPGIADFEVVVRCGKLLVPISEQGSRAVSSCQGPLPLGLSRALLHHFESPAPGQIPGRVPLCIRGQTLPQTCRKRAGS